MRLAAETTIMACRGSVARTTDLHRNASSGQRVLSVPEGRPRSNSKFFKTRASRFRHFRFEKKCPSLDFRAAARARTHAPSERCRPSESWHPQAAAAPADPPASPRRCCASRSCEAFAGNADVKHVGRGCGRWISSGFQILVAEPVDFVQHVQARPVFARPGRARTFSTSASCSA